MLSVLKDMNCDESGEPRWIDPKSSRPITRHGLRATFRTWGEDAGFPRNLLEESGRRWSELIGAPTASIDVERLWRLGLISVVASLLAAGVSARYQGASHDESPPSLRTP